MGTGAGTGLNFGNTKGSSNKDKSMPNHNRAVTPKAKFVNYSLDYTNPNARGKAEAYEKGLGFTKNNAESLIRQVRNAVTTGKVKPYEVSGSLYGV